MKKYTLHLLSFVMIVTSACNNGNSNEQPQVKNVDSAVYKQGSFGYDLNFLQQHDSVIVLETDGR